MPQHHRPPRLYKRTATTADPTTPAKPLYNGSGTARAHRNRRHTPPHNAIQADGNAPHTECNTPTPRLYKRTASAPTTDGAQHPNTATIQADGNAPTTDGA